MNEISPDRGNLQATYDEAGNRKSLSDARPITANYTYDELNRLKTISYPSNTENITFTFDSASIPNLTCNNGSGRLCQVQDAAGTTTFNYDVQGNQLQQVRSELGLNYTTSYSYDSVNRIQTITSPGNRSTVYTRDAIGRINSITTPVNTVSTTLVSNIQSNALGQVTQQSFANGYSSSLSYNSDGQSQSTAENPATPTGGTQVPITNWALLLLASGLALLLTSLSHPKSRYFSLLLVLSIGLSLPSLLYSAAAYAPTTLKYDLNGKNSNRGQTTLNYVNISI